MGGGSLKLDTNPRETHNTRGTHKSSHTKLKAIHAKLKSGDQQCIGNNLEFALSTLRATLILPTTQEHRKLPKPTTYKSKKLHPSWLPYINHEIPPHGKQTTYETITTYISMERGTTRKQGATHTGDTYMTPSDAINIPYDVIEIQDHKHLNNQTTYLVTQ